MPKSSSLNFKNM